MWLGSAAFRSMISYMSMPSRPTTRAESRHASGSPVETSQPRWLLLRSLGPGSRSLAGSVIRRTVRLSAPTSRHTGWICNSLCLTQRRDRSAPLSSSFIMVIASSPTTTRRGLVCYPATT